MFDDILVSLVGSKAIFVLFLNTSIRKLFYLSFCWHFYFQSYCEWKHEFKNSSRHHFTGFYQIYTNHSKNLEENGEIIFP